jgi:hypothetical protein
MLWQLINTVIHKLHSLTTAVSIKTMLLIVNDCDCEWAKAKKTILFIARYSVYHWMIYWFISEKFWRVTFTFLIRCGLHVLQIITSTNLFSDNRWRRADRQTDRKTTRQTDAHRQTDRQTTGQTKRQADKQTDRQTDRLQDRQTDRQHGALKTRHTVRRTHNYRDYQINQNHSLRSQSSSHPQLKLTAINIHRLYGYPKTGWVPVIWMWSVSHQSVLVVLESHLASAVSQWVRSSSQSQTIGA